MSSEAIKYNFLFFLCSQESALKALKSSNGRYDAAVDFLKQQPSPVAINGFGNSSSTGESTTRKL